MTDYPKLYVKDTNQSKGIALSLLFNILGHSRVFNNEQWSAMVVIVW